MRILLDTHTFLWHVAADARLPQNFRTAVEDPANDVFLSVASAWEVVVKNALGKLPLPSPAASFVAVQRAAHGITALSIDEGVMPFLAALPPLHRDPFDRMLVAQAL